MLTVQLMGGALDGQKFPLRKGDLVPPYLTFPNFKPVRICCGCSNEEIATRVTYERMYLVNHTVYYRFIGHAE